MLVMEGHDPLGQEPTLILCIVKDDVTMLTTEKGKILSYFGSRVHRVRNVVMFYQDTKEEMLAMLTDAGIDVSVVREKYLAGERTDRKREH